MNSSVSRAIDIAPPSPLSKVVMAFACSITATSVMCQFWMV